MFALLPIALDYMRDSERGTTGGVWEWGDLDYSVPSTNCLREESEASIWRSEATALMLENLYSENPDLHDARGQTD